MGSVGQFGYTLSIQKGRNIDNLEKLHLSNTFNLTFLASTKIGEQTKIFDTVYIGKLSLDKIMSY